MTQQASMAAVSMRQYTRANFLTNRAIAGQLHISVATRVHIPNNHEITNTATQQLLTAACSLVVC